jgi:hypothetical protein
VGEESPLYVSVVLERVAPRSSFRKLPGPTRTVAGDHTPVLNRSGRTVQIGFVMRFSGLLRSLCGPKSRVVPAPSAGFACGPRPCDRRWPQRASRVALLKGLHQHQLVLFGSRARRAPVVVGPPHEDEPRIGSLAKRPEHTHRLRPHGQRCRPIRGEAGPRSRRRLSARDGLPQAVPSDVRDGREIAPLRPADPGFAVVNKKLG